jgi:16S rRNA (guanine966-N2)-methyltransferase
MNRLSAGGKFSNSFEAIPAAAHPSQGQRHEPVPVPMANLRISGGAARGIPLRVPAGGRVRPATDSLRQAVFSSLGARATGARFLDLFAGSGAYGLEALSRGAAGGAFVENDHRAAQCLRINIAAVCKSLRRDESDLTVIAADVSVAPLAHPAAPDLVFVDPPYDRIETLAPPLFARLAGSLSENPDACVIFELPGEARLEPEGWICFKRLGRGPRQPTAAFYRRLR